MQSSFRPKSTPTSASIQFNTVSLNTIERINFLIKNLDVKLEQLSCLNSSKDICYKDICKGTKENREQFRYTSEGKQDPQKQEHLSNIPTAGFRCQLSNPLEYSNQCAGRESHRVAGGESTSINLNGEKTICSKSDIHIKALSLAGDGKICLSDEQARKDKLTTAEAKLNPLIVHTLGTYNKTSLDCSTNQNPETNSISHSKAGEPPTSTTSSFVKGKLEFDQNNHNENHNSVLPKGLYAKSNFTALAPKCCKPKRLAFKLTAPAKMNTITCVQAMQQFKKFGAETPEKASDVMQLKTLATIYRAKVIDAYRSRQIFTVFGNYNTIRRSLLKRGWLEKLPPNRHSKLQNLPEEVLLQHAKRGNEYEAVLVSKIINHFPAFFVWQPKGQRDLYADVQPYRNRIRRTHMLDFSTKVGLIGCAEQQLWYLQDGVAGMLYPRFYRLGGNQEELTAFTEDFRITQCRSLLQYLVTNIERPSEIIDYENGSVSPSTMDFALARVRRQLDDWENVVSLDTEPTQVPDTEWNDFLTDSSKVLNSYQKFKCTYRELAEAVKNARLLMSRIVEKRSDFKWDGCKNLWILKPGYQSRGLGIIIRNNLDDILRWSSTHANRRYIVQKYIEQPLLICKTKFDIRQYMLVFIRESTVQIWLYKDCYLRFSSQEYSIDDLREVVHLTNNSVQKKYKNKSTRDPRLPKNNMWSLDQFKAYLRTQTSQEVWESQVFAGFRQNLIAVVMASLDETNLCENSFELYGCDFMLDEEYNPILIEINSTPDLSASTEVTAHICPLVMQDCIKVVVDLPRNNRATTGQFKLVYEVDYKFKQDINSRDDLSINGKSMELCRRTKLPATPSKIVRKVQTKKAEVKANRKSSTQANEDTKKIGPAPGNKKSITTPPPSTGHSLNSAAKEALALRYTMPK